MKVTRGGGPGRSTEPRLTLLDRIAARRNGLARPLPYAVRTVRIPMRDGVELGATLCTPSLASRGVVLLQGPYGRSALLAANAAGIFAAQGYTVLFVSTRGTADSGGVLDPMRTDEDDGHDVASWMREQPWYGGRFATVGPSYLGYTQWALLAEPEPDHRAAVVTCGPHDFAVQGWGSGSFRLDLLVWTDLMVQQARHGAMRNLVALATAGPRLRPLIEGTPMVDAVEQGLAKEAPWLVERMRRSDLTDPYWGPMRQGGALDRCTIPVLIQAGWQDIFLDQSLEQFTRLRDRGQQVALTVGPWAHSDLVRGAQRILTPEVLDWLDEHFAAPAQSGDMPASPDARASSSRAHSAPAGAQARATARRAPVRVYVTGADIVQYLSAWPPEATWRTLHLGANGVLSETPPGAEATDASFLYNPLEPTPTVGGPALSANGYVDDSALAERADVLAWTGPRLPAGLTVMGVPRVELSHATHLPDADLFVRISDVDAEGRSRNVTERYVRVSGPGRGASAQRLVDLRGTAHTFLPGHRIRLVVAGGSFPAYARNAGTGENPLTARALRPNRHTVRLAGGASRVRLPVV